MKPIHKVSIAAALLSAGVLYASIHTDFDHHANFSKYHTYSWIGVKAGNPLWQPRIQRAVDSALAAKGLTRVPSGGDLAVSAIGKTKEEDTMETFYDSFPGWGWSPGWWGGMGMGGGCGMSTTQAVPMKVGDLTVDLFDGQSKQLVWRGRASDSLSSKPEKNEKKLDKSVNDMFKDFPPKAKS